MSSAIYKQHMRLHEMQKIACNTGDGLCCDIVLLDFALSAMHALLQDNIASSPEDACDIGDLMISQGFLNHATRDHAFKNEALYYRSVYT
jgi:hypothetical protein